MFRLLCLELIRPPAPGVISWVRVADTVPTLADVDVACAIASSTEVFYIRMHEFTGSEERRKLMHDHA